MRLAPVKCLKREQLSVEGRNVGSSVRVCRSLDLLLAQDKKFNVARPHEPLQRAQLEQGR